MKFKRIISALKYMLKNLVNRIYIYRLRKKGIKIGENVSFLDKADIRGDNLKGIEIGDNVKFQSRIVLVCWGDNAKLTIGNNALICDGVIISAHESIAIGVNSMIAAYSYIVDNNHGMNHDKPMIQQECTSEPINISDDVWIGTHCVVTNGVSIGVGSVIGAGSVATRSVGEYKIAAGSPAREIKSRI